MSVFAYIYHEKIARFAYLRINYCWSTAFPDSRSKEDLVQIFNIIIKEALNLSTEINLVVLGITDSAACRLIVNFLKRFEKPLGFTFTRIINL